MDEKKYPRIVSERDMKEWLPLCPVQIKRVRVVQNTPDECPAVTVISVPCGGFKIDSYTADIELQNERRERIGVIENVTLKSGESAPVPTESTRTTYAYVTLKSVRRASGETWENTDGGRGKALPEQEIFWQTDPLYEQIRRECDGVVDAKYRPDTVDGGWRCACGQVNLEESGSCGGCGCSREWLTKHLDHEYLAEQKKIADTKSEAELKKQKKKKEHEVSDKVKAILILAGFAAAVVLIVLTFTQFIPGFRYNQAVNLAAEGQYDEALAIFRDLDGFRDSAAKISDTNYKKAQYLTGLEEVNMTTSVKSPWFSITEDGVLSFKKSEYEDAKGTWQNFIIPDVVDNIVVRELDRNFFMNCKEMTVVTISDCVEVIGEQAFYNCEMLHHVNFGKSVKEIGARAFINCYALEEMEIPDTVTSLGLRAFNNCIKLKKVVLGSGITQIGSYQFSLCMELEWITLKSPVTEIGEYAFSECTSLKKIFCRFPESDWTEPEIGEGNEIYTGLEVLFDQ
ncbi:MAG: leucine-rich repeat domain-containing protein [Clostridia bacterium]|nr:leucine-rich repeat domain-containing protein [Clostridia bacterium]